MRYTRYIYLLCITICCHHLSAQQKKSDTSAAFKRSIYIKTNPLSVLELKPSLEVSMEAMLNKKFSIEQSVGLMNIYTSVYPKKRDIVLPFNYVGIETKSTFKYFFRGYDLSKWWKNIYMAPEIEFVWYTYGYEDEFCRFGCSYQQQIPVRIKSTEFAFGLKFGKEQSVGKKNKKGVIDFYGGIGYKYVMTKRSTIPADATEAVDAGFRFTNIRNTVSAYRGKKIGNYALFDVMLGFRIGYKVR